jgi:hypothetical protein
MPIMALAANGIIINGRTMVPVRGTFEELGFAVSWNSSTETATVENSKYTIKLTKNYNYFTVNDKKIYPDISQQIINGNFYLPLKAIGDCIGASTSWDSKNKIANISYNGMDSFVNCGTNSLNDNNSTSKNTLTETTTETTTIAKIKSISLNKSSINLEDGEIMEISANLSPSNYEEQYSWVTTNKNVVDIQALENDRCRLTAVGT